MRCGDAYAIQCGEDELMGSQDFSSEEALATLTVSRMRGPRDRILIGGLGMGFTLGAALRSLPDHSSVIVAELVPEVLGWAKGPLAHLLSDHLADPRVTVQIGDVHDVIAHAPAQFDAILLDVDNGPDGFMRDANDRLYCGWGLRSAFAALRPHGILAIWSSYDDTAFVDRLRGVGFVVEEERIADIWSRERKDYTIWLASKPDADSANMAMPTKPAMVTSIAR